jgi:hypothetical protein|eukprot:COSAG02_NODE_2802_length_8002_cov_11.765532_5_plen_96_part_00
MILPWVGVLQGEVAEYLAQSRGLQSVECQTEFQSTWLDNSKAKFALGAKQLDGMTHPRHADWWYILSDILLNSFALLTTSHVAIVQCLLRLAPTI